MSDQNQLLLLAIREWCPETDVMPSGAQAKSLKPPARGLDKEKTAIIVSSMMIFVCIMALAFVFYFGIRWHKKRAHDKLLREMQNASNKAAEQWERESTCKRGRGGEDNDEGEGIVWK